MIRFKPLGYLKVAKGLFCACFIDFARRMCYDNSKKTIESTKQWANHP